MIRTIKSILLLIATISISHAQWDLSTELKESLKLRIENGENTGIVIGLIDENGVAYYSYGVKSLKTNEPVDENSVFEIGSISKTFTGILLAEQVKRGKMNLDDPIQKYLPDGVTAPTRNGESIMLVHLSNHTSGLPSLPSNFSPEDQTNPFADYSVEQMFEFLNTYELTRDIGSQYEYSNYAVGLLGHILAESGSTTYEELMIEKIAKPLGLKNTRITLNDDMKSELAKGHVYHFEVKNWDLPTLAGAGAIRSTATDMIKYLSYNMGIKSSKLSKAMELSHQNTRTANAQPIVGLGWHRMISDGVEIIWHNGGTGGYKTFAGFTSDGKKGVVVLSNSVISVDDVGVHTLNPKFKLRDVKPSVGSKLKEIIDKDGLDALEDAYADLKKSEPSKYNFGEVELDRLGSAYINSNELEYAIAVLSLNLKNFNSSSNAHASLGKAFAKNGEKEKAVEKLKKAYDLNPANEEVATQLSELGVDPKSLVKEVTVDEEILDTYLGKYELVPGFIITITREESQLNAQATGQPMFAVFPKSENVFYFKVVEAQLTFNKGDDGSIESLTLLQGGREMVGKKL
ncbi:serine hydrolase [Ekhidna sp.]